jgi:pilus assembly protein CpaB
VILNKRVLPILFALIFGGLGLFLTSSYIQQQQQALEAERQKLYKDYQEPVNIIVARRPIAQDEVIVGDALGTRPIPKQFVPPTATARGEDIVGQQAKVPFSPGEPVLRDKIGPVQKQAEESEEDKIVADKLSLVTPPGRRAMALASDEIKAVSGYVRPGDRVDVLWTFQAPQKEQGDITMALFQNVQVLSVGDEILGAASKKEAGQSKTAKLQMTSGTVTIALEPKEIGMLLYARNNGSIHLSLRSSIDGGEDAKIEPVDRAAIMKQLKREDLLTTQKPREVEVCRGLDCSNIKVQQ